MRGRFGGVGPFGLAVVVALAAGCARGDAGGAGGSARTGASAPDGTVEVGVAAPSYRTVSLEGDSVSLAGERGQVVLLNIWATWCHPCRQEIPELRALHERFADQGLRLIGVSVDADDSDGAIRSFMQEFGMTFPIWRDPDERILTRYRTIGVPATFLIDRDGVLRWRNTGPIAPGDTTLANAITRALGD